MKYSIRRNSVFVVAFCLIALTTQMAAFAQEGKAVGDHVWTTEK